MSANIDLKALEAERRAFEEWAKSRYWNTNRTWGHYHPGVDALWQAWQARAALAAAPAATQEVQDAQPVALTWAVIRDHLGTAMADVLCVTHSKDGIDIQEPVAGLARLIAACAAPQPAAQPDEFLADRIAGTISRHIDEPLVQARVLAAAREIAGYVTHPHPSGDSGQLAGGQEDARDATRYRWLCSFATVDCPQFHWDRRAGLPKPKVDEVIDNQIARAQQDVGDGRAQGGGNG